MGDAAAEETSDFLRGKPVWPTLVVVGLVSLAVNFGPMWRGGHQALWVSLIFLVAGVLAATALRLRDRRHLAVASVLVFAYALVIVLALGPGHTRAAWVLCAGVVPAVSHGLRGVPAGLVGSGAVLALGWLLGVQVDPLWWEVRADPGAFARLVIELLAMQTALAVTVSGLLARLGRALQGEREHLANLEFQHAQLEIALDAVDQEQREKAELSARLERSRRLEAVGQVTSSIAHDIANMLVPVVSYTELARAETPEGSQLREDLEHVLGSARRIKDLTTQVLAVGREIGPTDEPVPLNRIVEVVARDTAALAGERVAVRTELPDRAVTVAGNEGALHRLLMNLAVNAVQAHEGGEGTVTLRLVPEASAGPRGVEDVSACVEVHDEGVGMTPETLEHIFEPHFTTKRLGSGNGLGLATVHGIVRALGGAIMVESERGKGSTFRVYLPRT